MKRGLFLLLALWFLGGAAVAATYDNLFVVGNACSAGWNPDGALAMTREGDDTFAWTGVLKKSGEGTERFKLLVARSWTVSLTCRLSMAGHQVLSSGEEAALYVKLDTDGMPDNAFQVKESGVYALRVNTSTMKMSCTKLSDYEEPDYTLYTRESFVSSVGATLNYRKLSPLATKAGERYPLVLFLHGAGERGTDNSSQLTYGGDLFLRRANREAYPAYVLFPQCPSNYFWTFDAQPPSYDATTFPAQYPVAPAIEQVKELVEAYRMREDVDTQRVYVVGISMGGMGTYDIVCRYPELFAAAVPICGGVNVQRLKGGVKEVAWRLFHGDADGVVTVNNSRRAYAALVEEGAAVQYIEFPGVDHFSWTNAFMREDFLSWIFSKKQTAASEVVPPVGEEQQGLTAYCRGNKLCVTTTEVGALAVALYALSGRLLHSFSAEGDGGYRTTREYLLPELPKGVYLLHLQVGAARCSLKIIR